MDKNERNNKKVYKNLAPRHLAPNKPFLSQGTDQNASLACHQIVFQNAKIEWIFMFSFRLFRHVMYQKQKRFVEKVQWLKYAQMESRTRSLVKSIIKKLMAYLMKQSVNAEPNFYYVFFKFSTVGMVVFWLIKNTAFWIMMKLNFLRIPWFQV